AGEQSAISQLHDEASSIGSSVHRVIRSSEETIRYEISRVFSIHHASSERKTGDGVMMSSANKKLCRQLRWLCLFSSSSPQLALWARRMSLASPAGYMDSLDRNSEG